VKADITPSGFPSSSAGKESACNVGDLDLISGLRDLAAAAAAAALKKKKTKSGSSSKC